jgi:hypothetical protein
LCAIQTREHFARFAVRGLVRAVLVAFLPALTFAEVQHHTGRGAPQLICEVRILATQCFNDWTQLANELNGNLVRNQPWVS